MKFKFKEQTKENILALTCSGILLLGFYFLITKFPQLKEFLGNILGILPVSYTHLDVYKRQSMH